MEQLLFSMTLNYTILFGASDIIIDQTYVISDVVYTIFL